MFHPLNNIYYINLSHRTDRKKEIEQELNNLNWSGTRIEAIQTINGRIGCTLSHIKCLQMAIDNNLDYIVILEDDIQFLNPPLFLKNLNTFFNTITDWDVLLLAGNNANTYQNIDNFCVKIKNTQTTTGYIVKKHYYETLLKNIKEGLKLLLEKPNYHFYFAIDKYWFSLQEKDNWYMIIPLTNIQRNSYSDIEKVNTNYGNLMLALDKPYFTRKR